jgi:hypothetical protein
MIDRSLLEPGQQIQIRKGIASGVDTYLYEKSEYDWRQMREIRVGLESGVRVGFYLEPLLPWQFMRDMRVGDLGGWTRGVSNRQYEGYLRRVSHDEVGQLFVSWYIRSSISDWLRFPGNQGSLDDYDGERIMEIHIGIMQNADVYQYADRGFDPNQMQKIRMGLAVGDDLGIVDLKWSCVQMGYLLEGKDPGDAARPYLDQDFSPAQWREIEFGLNKGVNVACYADGRFSAEQMREIALGLIQGKEAEKYADPSISVNRMRLLRVGLEGGVDLTDPGNSEFMEYFEDQATGTAEPVTRARSDNVTRMGAFDRFG